jgi:cytochrome c biogenesis protein CcmG, thiol:disulfide interchange protein DsbE
MMWRSHYHCASRSRRVRNCNCLLPRKDCVVLLLQILCLFLSSTLFGCQRREGLNPGDGAPSFSLPTLDGKMLSLEEYRGKVVILNFLASWCQPCIAELPAMARLSTMSPNIQIIGVGIDDDINGLREIVRSSGVTFPVVVDASGRVKSTYKIGGVPESFILDKDHRITLFPHTPSGPVTKLIGDQAWDSDPIKSFVLSLSSK